MQVMRSTIHKIADGILWITELWLELWDDLPWIGKPWLIFVTLYFWGIMALPFLVQSGVIHV
jgi:hypothetical protein